ncbi:MAG: ATP/GTP-binding protein [Cyanobacteria bacterium J06636_16]
MKVVRLVVTGPVGAGKSTFVQNISDVEAVDTERPVTDKAACLKETITVAMDFGRVSLNPQTVLHLYGTPGQSRFDFMWDILIKDAHAYILLVPSHLPSEFSNAKFILDFMQQRTTIPMIIGLTHRDRKDAWGAVSIAIALGVVTRQEVCLIIEVNPTDKRSIGKAIETVLSQPRA